jgi:hypothetical protein
VKILRAPLMAQRHSGYSGLTTLADRLRLKTFDDAIRAGENALSSGDDAAQTAALTALQGLA